MCVLFRLLIFLIALWLTWEGSLWKFWSKWIPVEKSVSCVEHFLDEISISFTLHDLIVVCRSFLFFFLFFLLFHVEMVNLCIYVFNTKPNHIPDNFYVLPLLSLSVGMLSWGQQNAHLLQSDKVLSVFLAMSFPMLSIEFQMRSFRLYFTLCLNSLSAG